MPLRHPEMGLIPVTWPLPIFSLGHWLSIGCESGFDKVGKLDSDRLSADKLAPKRSVPVILWTRAVLFHRYFLKWRSLFGNLLVLRLPNQSLD